MAVPRRSVKAEKGKDEHDHDYQADEIDQAVHCRLRIDDENSQFNELPAWKVPPALPN
jgi:hypothetical protein